MRKILLVLFVVALVVTMGVKVYSNEQRQTEWEDTRTIAVVYVRSGDTLDGICYEYKPDWMDVREYRYEVMQLNDMTSANLRSGQLLNVYVEVE